MDAAKVERLIVDVPTVRTDMESVLESENVGTGVDAKLGSEVLVSESVKKGTVDVADVVKKGATEMDDVDAIPVVEPLKNEPVPAGPAGFAAEVEDVEKGPTPTEITLEEPTVGPTCAVDEDVKKDPPPIGDVLEVACGPARVVDEEVKKDPPPSEDVVEELPGSPVCVADVEKDPPTEVVCPTACVVDEFEREPPCEDATPGTCELGPPVWELVEELAPTVDVV